MINVMCGFTTTEWDIRCDKIGVEVNQFHCLSTCFSISSGCMYNYYNIFLFVCFILIIYINLFIPLFYVELCLNISLIQNNPTLA